MQYPPVLSTTTHQKGEHQDWHSALGVLVCMARVRENMSIGDHLLPRHEALGEKTDLRRAAARGTEGT